MPALQHLNFSSPVTFPTALNTFLLSISAALLNPLSGYLSLFVGNKLGNYLVRRLLLQIIGFAIFMGYLRLIAHKMNLFEPEMALCITVLTFILVVSIFVSRIAMQLNTIEDSRAYAEEKFKLVFETTPNGIIIVDTKGKIVLANKQCEELFGYNQEEFSGKSIDMLIPNTYRKNHEVHRMKYIDEPIKRKMGGNDDLTALHKNGYEIPVEIGLNSVKINSERLIVASIIDTTDRKNYQQIILDKNQQLLIKNREVEQFAYIASHDLQEPLRTLRNYIMLIQEDYPELDEQLKMYLEDMNNASERMSKLVKHLLDHARIGAGTKEEPLSLDNCLQQAMKNLELLIKESNAEIKVNSKLPEIMGHESEIQRLFQNMIHNAIKFTKKGETPFIGISYTINPATKQTEIEISDNGVGIEEKQQQNIFKMFYKGTNINNQGGYGVGLANCKKIVELHNGKISVESIKNTGTTFKFTLG
ncbi:sensor histidine kinase [Flavobacterium sp. RHBU_3]|uniref:sensor histidine kinase n=1 Tax=Flavobacterium sp. RHBU_3 TaxID=3391184 RepID=UPI0039856422